MKCYVENAYFIEANIEHTETGIKNSVTFLTGGNDIVKAKIDNSKINQFNGDEKFVKYKKLYLDVFAYENKLYYKLLEAQKWQNKKS